MDLKTAPDLAVPFAVVKCRWKFANNHSEFPGFSINDGAILLSKTQPRSNPSKKKTEAKPQMHPNDTATNSLHPLSTISVDEKKSNELNEGKARQRSLLETPPISPLPLSKPGMMSIVSLFFKLPSLEKYQKSF